VCRVWRPRRRPDDEGHRRHEDFSGYDAGSRPTTFSGGTIDSADYAAGDPLPNGWGGSILVAGPYFNGFASGTHFLFTGIPTDSAKLRFTNPVNSVSLQAESDKTFVPATLTLTGYDASGKQVDQFSVHQDASTNNGANAQRSRSRRRPPTSSPSSSRTTTAGTTTDSASATSSGRKIDPLAPVWKPPTGGLESGRQPGPASPGLRLS
jgi:hypothetical protein